MNGIRKYMNLVESTLFENPKDPAKAPDLWINDGSVIQLDGGSMTASDLLGIVNDLVSAPSPEHDVIDWHISDDDALDLDTVTPRYIINQALGEAVFASYQKAGALDQFFDAMTAVVADPAWLQVLDSVETNSHDITTKIAKTFKNDWLSAPKAKGNRGATAQSQAAATQVSNFFDKAKNQPKPTTEAAYIEPDDDNFYNGSHEKWMTSKTVRAKPDLSALSELFQEMKDFNSSLWVKVYAPAIGEYKDMSPEGFDLLFKHGAMAEFKKEVVRFGNYANQAVDRIERFAKRTLG